MISAAVAGIGKGALLGVKKRSMVKRHIGPHDGPLGAGQGVAGRFKRLLECTTCVGRAAQQAHELAALRRVLQLLEDAHNLFVQVVVDLNRAARLAHEYACRAAEGLDVHPVRGQVADDPGGDLPFATEVA